MVLCSTALCETLAKTKGQCQRCYLRSYYLKNVDKLKQRTKEWRLANPERARENDRRKQEADPERYKAHKSAYYERCGKEKSRAYRKENAEEIRERERLRQAANRDKILLQRKARYQANLEANREKLRLASAKEREQHPERQKARSRKFKANNKEKVNADTHKRRARLKGGGGTYTRAEWNALLDRYNHTCPACGSTGIRLTVDHVVPIQLGGSNTVDNLQPLCKSCNSRKHIRHTTRYEPWPQATSN